MYSDALVQLLNIIIIRMRKLELKKRSNTVSELPFISIYIVLNARVSRTLPARHVPCLSFVLKYNQLLRRLTALAIIQ